MNPHISETAYHFLIQIQMDGTLTNLKSRLKKDAVSERVIHRY